MKTEIIENPLFKIARKKHNQQFLTFEFDFLHMNIANENTFVLGFCAGVDHATSIFKEQIEMLQKEVQKLKGEETKIVLDEENARTLHY